MSASSAAPSENVCGASNNCARTCERRIRAFSADRSGPDCCAAKKMNSLGILPVLANGLGLPMAGIAQQSRLRSHDWQKMERTTTRDDEFAAFVSRQTRFVFRVAYSILRNVQDSDDVVQETFLKLYRSHAWERVADERRFWLGSHGGSRSTSSERCPRIRWRAMLHRPPRIPNTPRSYPIGIPLFAA